MQTKPTITVFGYCTVPHASQIYTGLYLLKKANLIQLEFSTANKIPQFFGLTPTPAHIAAGVFAMIDGQTVFFDLLDSTAEIAILITKVKHYLKRSFVPALHSQLGIKPLGLNYEVYNRRPHPEEMRRILALNCHWKSSLKHKLSTLADATGIGFLPRISCFDAESHRPAESLYDVLFIARTWDPQEPQISLSEAEREDRFQINLTRAALIRTLKAELGERFLGGLSATPHARKEFPDIVLDNAMITKKKNYLQMVPRIPICIATTGLHGSIGWKFAEYIALGRAVVAEATNIEVPHQFAEGKHFLSFTTNEHCVANIERLLKDQGYRAQMMQNNKAYYNQHLRPDMFVLGAIASIKA
ncbi:MAG: glycosyltransferase [Pseudomonadota bacterium]|nr:glycosyltransferase [Pseudomonadota bacterium]